MELKIGTEIQYASAAGVRKAIIRNISIAPTAKPDFLNTWLTIEVPVQKGVKFASTCQIPADNMSLKMFQVEVI